MTRPDPVKRIADNQGDPVIIGELQWRTPSPYEVYGSGDPEGLPWLYIGSMPDLMPEVDGIPTRRHFGGDAQYQRRMFDVLPTVPAACFCDSDVYTGCHDYTDQPVHAGVRSYSAFDFDRWRQRNPEPGARPVW